MTVKIEKNECKAENKKTYPRLMKGNNTGNIYFMTGDRTGFNITQGCITSSTIMDMTDYHGSITLINEN